MSDRKWRVSNTPHVCPHLCMSLLTYHIQCTQVVCAYSNVHVCNCCACTLTYTSMYVRMYKHVYIPTLRCRRWINVCTHSIWTETSDCAIWRTALTCSSRVAILTFALSSCCFSCSSLVSDSCNSSLFLSSSSAASSASIFCAASSFSSSRTRPPEVEEFTLCKGSWDRARTRSCRSG